MPEQTQLPPEGEREYPDACAWCGARPAKPFEVAKAGGGKDKRTGAPIVRRPAVAAPACESCSARLRDQPATP
jgi:hypothetical protein